MFVNGTEEPLERFASVLRAYFAEVPPRFAVTPYARPPGHVSHHSDRRGKRAMKARCQREVHLFEYPMPSRILFPWDVSVGEVGYPETGFLATVFVLKTLIERR